MAMERDKSGRETYALYSGESFENKEMAINHAKANSNVYTGLLDTLGGQEN